jgi:hypothetical protein
MKKMRATLFFCVISAGLASVYAGIMISPGDVGEWMGFRSAPVTYTSKNDYLRGNIHSARQSIKSRHLRFAFYRSETRRRPDREFLGD